jgi:predicted nucleic acid-binding protein
MAGELLLDTGALVSLLDRSQTHHLKCRRAFADWTGLLVSTEAVLTEATHLLAGVHGGRAACVDFFLSRGALLVPSSMRSLQRVRKLLDKNADLPMDFADATLVRLPSQRPEAFSHPTERLKPAFDRALWTDCGNGRGCPGRVGAFARQAGRAARAALIPVARGRQPSFTDVAAPCSPPRDENASGSIGFAMWSWHPAASVFAPFVDALEQLMHQL